MKVVPAMKAEFAKQMPKFEQLVDNANTSYIPPDKVLRAMDSSFESFFYKRDYTEHNFWFYMQVCAQ